MIEHIDKDNQKRTGKSMKYLSEKNYDIDILIVLNHIFR